MEQPRASGGGGGGVSASTPHDTKDEYIHGAVHEGYVKNHEKHLHDQDHAAQAARAAMGQGLGQGHSYGRSHGVGSGVSPIPQDSLSSPNHLPPTQEERARFSTPLPAGSSIGGYPYSSYPHTVGGHGPAAAHQPYGPPPNVSASHWSATRSSTESVSLRHALGVIEKLQVGGASGDRRTPPSAH